jgi:hypothetical protein
MQTKAIGPSRHRSAAGEGLFQKGRELCRGHLSDAHREFPVANAARATDVALAGNVVGGSVKIRSARSSPRSASYASLSRASPQNQAVTPRPPHIAAVTAASRTIEISSSAPSKGSLGAPSAASSNMTSISPRAKPVASISKPRSISPWSSIARTSRSQPPLSASLLSART